MAEARFSILVYIYTRPSRFGFNATSVYVIVNGDVEMTDGELSRC